MIEVGSLEVGRHGYILIDGDCGICTHSSAIARRIDAGGRFRIEPYQNFPEAELKKFGLNYLKCARELQVIAPSGRVYRGAFGINCFLYYFYPWKLAVLCLYALPVLLLAEVIGYAMVAKNRHHISRLLGVQSCKTGAAYQETTP